MLLSAYNNATRRLNFFNQTDAVYTLWTGGIRHTLLAGAEEGRQITDNFRNTGYFNNTGTSILVPFDNPTTSITAAFRQSASDADNHLRDARRCNLLARPGELSSRIQAIVGLRIDHFDLRYQNNRTGDDLRRIDNLVSPRAGLIYRPAAVVSVYASYRSPICPARETSSPR